jgi:signal transduction histidine kinase
MNRRFPWVVWTLVLVVLAATASLGVLNGSFGEDGFFLVIALIMIVGYTTVGALIVSRTTGNPIGWLLMMVGIGFLLGGVTDEYLQYALDRGGADDPFTVFMGWLANWIFLFVAIPVPWILLLFPSGALPTRRWRPVAIGIAALSGLILIAAVLNPGEIDIDAPAGVPLPLNPTGVPTLRDAIDVVFNVAGFGLLGLGFLAVLALVLRYRRSVGDERQQMRWFVAAVALAAPLLLGAIVTGWGLTGTETRPLNDALFFAFFLVLAIGLPGACAVAILRYRLYDLDVVVKKTVLYAIVALLLMAAFSVFALLVGRAVIEANPLAIVASIAVGLAVWPAMRFARKVADRVVYGRRATPYEVLSEFTHRVGGSYASEDVLPRMASILAGAVGASRAVVWLRIGDELRPSGLAPAGVSAPGPIGLRDGELPALPADAAVAVRDQGELLGALAVDMPANDPMSPSKERLARDLASQAGLVLRNVRLIEELRASRQRLVAAQDEERRRLERNIHDGAQQQLVALTVKLRLLEQLAERDPSTAREMAAQIQIDTTAALDDLRDLARGIYPPLLADKGLPAALEAQARKSPVPVAVEADAIGRYPQDVEAAVYFSCLEALQNVAKYAKATRVSISIVQRDGRLSFAVADDGVGFDPASVRRGSGLQGIADRLDALGGRLEVTSEADAGTTVRGTVPTGYDGG